jgi:hypothetical protein
MGERRVLSGKQLGSALFAELGISRVIKIAFGARGSHLDSYLSRLAKE